MVRVARLAASAEAPPDFAQWVGATASGDSSPNPANRCRQAIPAVGSTSVRSTCC